MKLTNIVFLSVCIAMTACATPSVVEVVMPGDEELSCGQLKNAYAETKRFKEEAEAEKGVTGGNVARLLFWPAIIGTYMNSNEAIQAADSRKVHLMNIMRNKKCSGIDNL